MAGVKMTDAGGQQMLKLLFGTGATVDTAFEIECFVDTNAVGDNGVDVAHTEASTLTGYVQKAVTKTAVISTFNGIPMATFPQVDWNITGPIANGPVRGYSIYGAQSNVKYFEEVLPTPLAPAAGEVMSIIPRVQLGNGIPK